MTNKSITIRLLTLGILVQFLTYCATPFSPSGGEKDTEPPSLLQEKSTTNKQTNFKKQDIILNFNEWINLKDVFNQVVVSPPLEYPFDLKIKGKSIRFKFDEKEVLRENATYTINFGDAVQDLTEGNPAENLRFVFSTGSFIDSLAIQGKLLDAITQEPIENALFMLYEQFSDSVVYKKRPFYFAKSDKAGFFKIENIKSGTFKGVALKDEDLNYLYSKNELIGFLDTLLRIEGTAVAPTIQLDSLNTSKDSASIVPNKIIPGIEIALFKEDLPLIISQVDSSQSNYLKLGFNQTPYGISIETEGRQDTLYQEIDQDSLKLWFPHQGGEQWQVIISRDSLLRDTISLPPVQSDKEQLNTFWASKPTSITIRPQSNIEIPFNHPLNRIDTSKIFLTEDSLHTPVAPSFFFDTISGRKLTIKYHWKEEIPYQLLILPGGVTDIFGLSNQDSIQLEAKMASPKLFGNLFLTINHLDSTQWYICQLFYKETISISRWIIRNKTEYNHRWKALKAGDYQVIIQKDRNKNGRWDSGSYDNYRQIEKVYEKSLEPLRQNWDLEAEINLE